MHYDPPGSSHATGRSGPSKVRGRPEQPLRGHRCRVAPALNASIAASLSASQRLEGAAHASRPRSQALGATGSRSRVSMLPVHHSLAAAIAGCEFDLEVLRNACLYGCLARCRLGMVLPVEGHELNMAEGGS